jgi:Tol biopolymer transport system component
MTNWNRIIIICLIFTSFIFSSCTAKSISEKSGFPDLIAFSTNDNNIVHIFTINPDGTNRLPTSVDKMTRDWYPDLSADGKQIAFSSGESGDYEIWTMNADGSNRKKITSRQGLDTLPRWSPDDTKIVFTSTFREEGTYHLSYEICMVDSDGSNFVRLTHGTHTFQCDTKTEHKGESHCSCGEEGVAWNNVPTWSPDGSKILFASNEEGDPEKASLYTMNIDGTNRKKLGLIAGIEGSQPDWSPVTNKIVFTRKTADKNEIWLIDAGSPFPEWTAKKLTYNNYNNQNAVWSPDGKQIAFMSDQYGIDNMFIMDADGNNLHRLTNSTVEEIHPTWR